MRKGVILSRRVRRVRVPPNLLYRGCYYLATNCCWSRRGFFSVWLRYVCRLESDAIADVNRSCARRRRIIAASAGGPGDHYVKAHHPGWSVKRPAALWGRNRNEAQKRRAASREMIGSLGKQRREGLSHNRKSHGNSCSTVGAYLRRHGRTSMPGWR